MMERALEIWGDGLRAVLPWVVEAVIIAIVGPFFIVGWIAYRLGLVR
jgi:hypothetical protein